MAGRRRRRGRSRTRHRRRPRGGSRARGGARSGRRGRPCGRCRLCGRAPSRVPVTGRAIAACLLFGRNARPGGGQWNRALVAERAAVWQILVAAPEVGPRCHRPRGAARSVVDVEVLSTEAGRLVSSRPGRGALRGGAGPRRTAGTAVPQWATGPRTGSLRTATAVGGSAARLAPIGRCIAWPPATRLPSVLAWAAFLPPWDLAGRPGVAAGRGIATKRRLAVAGLRSPAGAPAVRASRLLRPIGPRPATVGRTWSGSGGLAGANGSGCMSGVPFPSAEWIGQQFVCLLDEEEGDRVATPGVGVVALGQRAVCSLHLGGRGIGLDAQDPIRVDFRRHGQARAFNSGALRRARRWAPARRRSASDRPPPHAGRAPAAGGSPTVARAAPRRARPAGPAPRR